MRRPLLTLLPLLLSLLVLAPATPAAAHGEDPQVVTLVDAVEPATTGLSVVVVTGAAPQLLLDNRTGGPVEVLDQAGRVFLRIGPDRVEADFARPATYQAENPFGSASLPPEVAATPDAPARFRVVATGSSYGWYDHRLHPAQVTVPPAVRDAPATSRLADFAVPLRVHGAAVTVRGHLEFRPQLGGFVTAVDPPPAGVQAVVLQGRLPGLAVSASAGTEVLVRGTAGEPFARLTAAGAEVNERSPTYVADAQARGLPTTVAADPAAAPVWRRTGTTPSLTWLDPRLRWPDQLPPEAALRSADPTVLGRWSVPVEVSGQAAGRLSGTITWQPDPARQAVAGGPGGTAGPAASRGLSSGGVALVAGGVALLVLALGGGLLLRRRRS